MHRILRRPLATDTYALNSRTCCLTIPLRLIDDLPCVQRHHLLNDPVRVGRQVPVVRTMSVSGPCRTLLSAASHAQFQADLGLMCASRYLLFTFQTQLYFTMYGERLRPPILFIAGSDLEPHLSASFCNLTGR